MLPMEEMGDTRVFGQCFHLELQCRDSKTNILKLELFFFSGCM